MHTVASLPSLDALHQHVRETLCAHDKLDPKQTPLYQAVILRRGKPCGLFFQAQGPRMLKTYAVWAGDEKIAAFENPLALPVSDVEPNRLAGPSLNP